MFSRNIHKNDKNDKNDKKLNFCHFYHVLSLFPSFLTFKANLTAKPRKRGFLTPETPKNDQKWSFFGFSDISPKRVILAKMVNIDQKKSLKMTK